MIKKYNRFVKESVENKGMGPGNRDLFPSAPKKQTINRSNQTIDFLRIGKHIFTKKIDGFIDSVQNENIFIVDRVTGEIKHYTIKEVLKELSQNKDNKNVSSTVQGFQGVPAWGIKQKIYEDVNFDPNIYEFEDEEDDDEIINVSNEFTYGIDDDGEEENDIERYEYEKDFLINDIDVNDIERNRMLYGTEDNPDGLPNKGINRELSNEKWIKHWEKYHEDQEYIEDDIETEEIEEEEEFPIMRGTEDNPLPDKRRRPIIEKYD